MTSVNDWYSNFLARRCIPIKRELPERCISDGFALQIEKVHLAKLIPSTRYRISCCFFDAKTCQLFGSPYHGPWSAPNNQDCDLHDVVFFHCPRLDEGVQLILEIVADPQNAKEDLQTVAWAPIQISGFYEALPEYGKSPAEIPLTKLKLHPGTPKVLTFTKDFNSEASSGVLECLLCIHPLLADAFDFFPDFCIVGARENIPGLAFNPPVYQLAAPRRLASVQASLEDIGLSFGPHAEKIEKLILDDMKTDRLYRENHAPGTLLQPMQVLERRLRVSVHNGYTFLFEPLVVHLSSADEMAMGTHSLRRKGRPLSRSSSDIKTEINTLFVRSKVSLPRLVDDSRVTVVFALDYLIGSKQKQGNIGGDAHSIVIGWGAWKPTIDRRGSGAVHASVALIGGPRPNPEECLCFKNLLNLYRKDDSMFTESAPKITIHFIFSIEDGFKSLDSRANLSTRLDDSARTTPAPRKELEDHPPPISDRSEKGRVSERESEPESEYSTRLPPIEKPKPPVTPTVPLRDQFNHLIEIEVPSPRDDIASTYEVPWKELRMSPISRSVQAILTKVKYSIIQDRHGEAVPYVDPSLAPILNMNIEVNDRLDTNEIVLQFLALKCLDRLGAVQPHRVFFTTQFFRFPMLTTEEMLLSESNNNGEPNILTRLDADGKEVAGDAGFTAKFIVDRPAGAEEKEFVRFLQWGHLFIDVWDAQSLILLGTAAVNLRPLLRQGNEALAMAVQCPVVFSSLVGEKRVSALLFLKMANIGHPSSNQIDMVNSRTSAVVSRRLRRIGEEGPDSYRILAKPMSTQGDGALQRFLQAQRLDVQQRYDQIFNEQSHEKLRQWERLKTNLPQSTQKEEMKKFVFDEQLEAYRRLRYESKASKLLQAVFRGITTPHTIYPGLGEQNFFEFLLENPFSEPINCVIEMDCPELQVIADSEMWSFYKRQNAIQTPLEKDMVRNVKPDRAEVFLKPMETVYVPFLFTYSAATTGNNYTETKVLFRRWDNGQPLAILDLKIHRRPPVVYRTMRFYHCSNVQCSRNIVIDSLIEERRAVSVKCSDATARVNLRTKGVVQELAVSVFCGDPGTNRSLLVLIYGDTQGYRLLSAWHLVFHSVERLEVRATMGQNCRFGLNMTRKETGNQLIEVHSDNSDVSPSSGRTPVLATSPQMSIPMQFVPKTTGRQQVLLTAVDGSSRQLQHAWLMISKTAQPTITRRYELKVPINQDQVVAKKLPFSNPYSITRSFRLSSSRPELVQFERDIVELEGGETGAVNIFFLNVIQKPLTLEILVFFQNSATEQTEDTFALNVMYE